MNAPSRKRHTNLVSEMNRCRGVQWNKYSIYVMYWCFVHTVYADISAGIRWCWKFLRDLILAQRRLVGKVVVPIISFYVFVIMNEEREKYMIASCTI